MMGYGSRTRNTPRGSAKRRLGRFMLVFKTPKRPWRPRGFWDNDLVRTCGEVEKEKGL